jgi:hypothetical protein
MGVAMKTYRDLRTVNIATTDTQLAGPNPRRRGLMISSPPTNRITVSFGDTAAVLDQGITLYPGNPPLLLEVGMWGDSITEGIRCISAVGAQNISIVDLMHGL